MQLSAPSADQPVPTDVASALRDAAASLGHRPLVTVISARGREEQGAASLAQWAAKGAHLVELDLLLSPGERLGLDAPLSWTSAAVALAAWWAGLCVDLDGDAEMAVVHESRATPPGGDLVDVRPRPGEMLWLGDAVDGAPLGAVAGEPWVRAVQTFPDQPPAPRGTADHAALRSAGRSWTQRELLAMAAKLGGAGTLGFAADELDPVTGLVAVALRPLVVGRPTVVLQGVDRSAAAGEKVRTWLPDGDA